ncbi:AAA family ATPase [Syntrophomonas wolfei]|uniref:SpoVK n=1 Tax=Syntrophomonas wolfei subsp. wolfei (strain DSM 2245B / Goettingen) TaxID=335541 RepID=Q0AYA7_SYNWW|nr:AAA family ATPase [Syntrophomonas wolfei]ABI68297.1 SpoVK [Syntrophomonas wolfei subsp. wolfei str. Goettingen G311]
MEISMRFTDINQERERILSCPVPGYFPRKDSFLELERLIGLREVKRTLAEVAAFTLIQNRRSELRLKSDPTALHMVFKGNPGTGKTTVARILGRVFNEIGILSKGHLLEVERADLVGEYIGHTAQKTREILKRAMGGIVFIDEAYSLAQGGERDFGKEAISTLVKAMEDYRDNLVVILAGYSQEIDRFLKSNPGLRSRFPIHIDFCDYNAEELFQIALQIYQEREYELTSRCRWKLKQQLNEFVKNRHSHSGNARYVRNLAEKSIRLQALRIVDKDAPVRRDLVTIEEADLPDPRSIQA